MQRFEDLAESLKTMGISPKRRNKIYDIFIDCYLKRTSGDKKWLSMHSLADIFDSPDIDNEKKARLLKEIFPNGRAKIIVHPKFMKIRKQESAGTREYHSYEKSLESAMKRWAEDGDPVFIFVEEMRLTDTMNELKRVENGNIKLGKNEWIVPTTLFSPSISEEIYGGNIKRLAGIMKDVKEIEISGELSGPPEITTGCVPHLVKQISKQLPDIKIVINKKRVFPQRKINIESAKKTGMSF